MNYYEDKEPERMEMAWLWLKWVALPTVVIVLAYGLYCLVTGT